MQDFRLILAVLICVMGSGGAKAADPDKPLAGADLEMAVKMNDVYARHMYSSVCIEHQKAYFLPRQLSVDDEAKKMQSFKDSCDCLTNRVLKESSPNDVIDYVTAMNGGKKSMPGTSGKKTKAFPDLPKGSQAEEKLMKIGQIGRDEKIRKDCGFTR